MLDARAELRPAAPQREKKRRVEFLDVDAAVLDASMFFASSTSLRAAASGSEYGRSLFNFMNRPPAGMLPSYRRILRRYLLLVMAAGNSWQWAVFVLMLRSCPTHHDRTRLST